MGKENKKKEKNSVVLPKAWQSLKHRNETAQARTNYEDTWKAIGTIALIALVLFVLLGGVSQTGVIKAIFGWSNNVGHTISDWLSGGSVVVNDDGIYYDPTGQSGDKISDENAPEVINPIEQINEDQNNSENTEELEQNEETNTDSK